MLRSFMRFVVLALVLVPLSLSAGDRPYAAQNGKWMSGDFHTHTFLTDGGRTEADVVQHAFPQFGLDWMANSEHGGTSVLDPFGNPFPAPVWRWITLRDYSFPIVQGLRATYPGHLLIQGLEWNNPTHEHTSVGIINAEPRPISDFEYRFDSSDNDGSRASESLAKQNKTHADAVAALKWLETNYKNSSYAVLNHPSRSLKVLASDIREFNDVAPDVCFGMEGLPGHQKDPSRGGYSYGPYKAADGSDITYKARTFGGADYMTAKVGGLWDSLLGEGRHFWIFNNSDFHNTDGDFWPGEYSRTYTFVPDSDRRGFDFHRWHGEDRWKHGNKVSYSELLAGLRSGRTFVANGGLIDELDFYAKSRDDRAYMGETLTVHKGDHVQITIRFRSPVVNNNNEPVQVDHVDLIAGEFSDVRAVPGTAAYNADTNPTTRVMARFTAADWEREDGWYIIKYVVKKSAKNTYFRLRGTNLGVSTPNESDGDGNPLIDTLAGPNDATKAYADLWFYSNPVFVKVR